jgi:hypothetical protein
MKQSAGMKPTGKAFFFREQSKALHRSRLTWPCFILRIEGSECQPTIAIKSLSGLLASVEVPRRIAAQEQRDLRDTQERTLPADRTLRWA